VTGDVTIERCACGGYLNADYSSPRDVAAKVEAHRLTLRHREWAARMGYGAPWSREIRK
jgi:hypothetical protein